MLIPLQCLCMNRSVVPAASKLQDHSLLCKSATIQVTTPTLRLGVWRLPCFRQHCVSWKKQGLFACQHIATNTRKITMPSDTATELKRLGRDTHESTHASPSRVHVRVLVICSPYLIAPMLAFRGILSLMSPSVSITCHTCEQQFLVEAA